MKFLKFVIDYENQAKTWQEHADEGLGPFLEQQYQLPKSLQDVLTALTLSLYSPEKTTVKWALPRIARHLTSIGVFGPGFGSVIPKWGGGSEIAQVACRAGAVGGGVYILGTGVESRQEVTNNERPQVEVKLSNGEVVKTARLVGQDARNPDATKVSKLVVIAADPLSSLFKSTIEGSPPSAVSVITFPPNSITKDNTTQDHPIYIMTHSNETGECPAGQSKFASISFSHLSAPCIT
jgi:RAB protein geranylgeranyltransferase component A